MQVKHDEKKLIYWLRLIRAPNLGIRAANKLFKQFCSIENLFQHLYSGGSVNLPDETLAYLRQTTLNEVEKDLAWLAASSQHSIITLDHSLYPMLLREIHNAPLALFLKGDLTCLGSLAIAIVGSRNPTPSAVDVAWRFARELANQGICIASGLALGIDTAAHQGALKDNSPTIAVVGTGLDQTYPKKNRDLAERIAENGLVLSEFPLGYPLKPENFPRRNRLISGITLGTVVVEATLKSGSLITAKYAAEQNREVFAVPGSILNPQTRGCHLLIKQGAKLVEGTADILEELWTGQAFSSSIQPSNPKIGPQNKLDVAYTKLLECVGFEPTPIENVVMRSGLSASKVAAELVELELLGYIQYSLGGYSRVHP